MIFVAGIPAVVVALCWMYLFQGYLNHAEDYFGFSVISLFIAAIAAMFGHMLASIIGNFLPKQWKLCNTLKLVAMRDASHTSGSFFLGCGSISSGQYYSFYKESGAGFVPGKIKVADNVTIFEEEKDGGGTLKCFELAFSNLVFKFFGLTESQLRYEFYIPKGSLRQEFVLT